MYRAKQKANSTSATNITTSYINPKPFSPLRDNDSKNNDSSEDPDEEDDLVQLRHDTNDENESENNENSSESIRYNANNANITNNNSNAARSINIDKKFVKMTSVSAPLVHHSHELNSDVIKLDLIKFFFF